VLTRLKPLFDSAKTHQGFRRYFANTSWMFAEQILRMVAGLLVGIWVARYLGPEQFGVFSYAVAFAALFSSIAKLGLDSIVVRDLVREPNQRDLYLGTAFWLKLFGAVVMLGVIGITMQLTSSDATTKLYIFVIASGAIFQSFEVVDFYFQSRVLSKFVSICKLTQLLISSLIKLYLIFLGADLIWFVLVSLVDQIILALSLFFAYRYQKLGGFYRHFDRTIAKQLLHDSWPLIFSGLAIMIHIRIDQIMIKEMLGAKEVGLYSAAVRLSELWYFIPVIITNSLFTSIVNAKKENEALYYARLQRLYTLLVWIAIGIALPMTFLSDWLVILLYGEAYRHAGQVLMVHIWSSVFVFMGVAFHKFLLVENLNKKSIHRMILAAVTNIAFNFFLIPAYGITGAAISTLLAHIIANYFYDFFDTSTRSQFKMKTIALINPMQIITQR
jgi:O-antigen/teichoic acid export membrane protein